MRHLLFAFIIPIFLISQENYKKTCGVKRNLIQVATKNNTITKANLSEIITIPVHFIIVHKPNEEIGEGRNLSYEQIYSQIEVLNEDFRKLNPSFINTPDEFLPVAADCMIEFCLATIDEYGNSTNGITRYPYDSNQMSENYWEDVISQETYWDPKYFLNIWVARLGGGNDGFAYMPSDNVPLYLDGVVVKDRYVGRGGSAQWPFDEGHLTTHEVGHWLGVDHTWDSWDNYSCSIDDGIEDTPEQYEEYYDCPSYPQYSCDSSDMFMNFMDYVDDACLSLWTEGQKNLMHNIIQNDRNELLNNPYNCDNSSNISEEIKPRKIIQTIDLLGRPSTHQQGFNIKIYNDGSVKKIFIIK